jgi:hypothetical protein
VLHHRSHVAAGASRKAIILAMLNRRASKHDFRPLDRRDVESHENTFVATSYHDKLHSLAVIAIELLVRHIRGEIGHVSGAGLGREFKLIPPSDLDVPSGDKDRYFVPAMMMPSRLSARRKRDGADPGPVSSRTGKIESRRTPGTDKPGLFLRIGADNGDTAIAPRTWFHRYLLHSTGFAGPL